MPTCLSNGALALIAAAAIAAGGPAFAQKSKDTLRSVTNEPVSIIDDAFNAQPAFRQINWAIYDSFAKYDWNSGKWVPSLAKSWKQIDDRTIEYELRDDVKFHNGDNVTADDVVQEWSVLLDPKIKFRFKETRYGFVESVEKVGPTTVRFRAKGPSGTLLARTGITHVYPGKMFVEQKAAFGKAPVGTGPYKAAQVDPAKGVVLVKNEDFQLEGPARPKGKIGRIEVASMPDTQTQIARMMVGEQDFMFNVNVDQARDLVQNPQFKMFVNEVPSFSYLQFDAADRSGIGVLKDQRVRLALSMAINREKIKENLLPKEAQGIPLPDGPCDRALVACAFTAKLPQFNPERAKALLSQAGHADGFDITLTGWGAVKDTLTAVAGDLRAIGVRAQENYVTYATYTKMRQDGKFNGLVSYWDNAGSQPDAENTINFFYLPSDRDYFQDKELHELATTARGTADFQKRSQIYQKVFDAAIQRSYIMPLLKVPSIVVYSKDVVIEGGQKSPEGYWYNYISWAK